MNIDTNIDNYTTQELYDIVGTENKDEIETKIDAIINQVFLSATPNKSKLMVFLNNIKDKLLAQPDAEEEEEAVEEMKPVPSESRLILIDSVYRNQDSASSTNFMIELKYPLINVTSLRLFAYSIPYSIYNIDGNYGNNLLTAIFDQEQVVIEFPSGKYNIETFLTQLNTVISQAAQATASTEASFTYNTTSGNLTFTSSDETMSIFFDNNTVSNSFTDSLGWMMGYRIQTIESGTTATCMLNLIGPKYLVLDLDDFNNNAASNVISTASNTNEYISMPSYYVAGQPTLTFPRTLTQTQIYTIQEILKTNKSNQQSASSILEPLATVSNSFAIIPFKHNENLTNINVEFGGSLQENRRAYLGPVTIRNFRVKLYNDKNNIVNLNGLDWNFILIAEIKS